MCWRHELSLVEGITLTKQGVGRHTWMVFLFVVGKIKCISATVSITKIAEKKHNPWNSYVTNEQKIPGKKNCTNKYQSKNKKCNWIRWNLQANFSRQLHSQVDASISGFRLHNSNWALQVRWVSFCVHMCAWSLSDSFTLDSCCWVIFKSAPKPKSKWQDGSASIQRSVFI